MVMTSVENKQTILFPRNSSADPMPLLVFQVSMLSHLFHDILSYLTDYHPSHRLSFVSTLLFVTLIPFSRSAHSTYSFYGSSLPLWLRGLGTLAHPVIYICASVPIAFSSHPS